LERPSHRLLVYLFALGLAHLAFLFGQELFRARALALEKARLEAALQAARSRVERLRAEAEAAQDPLYLEALVRRLGFVSKEETLYANPSRLAPGGGER
jgi:cell division protein FtsB